MYFQASFYLLDQNMQAEATTIPMARVMELSESFEIEDIEPLPQLRSQMSIEVCQL